MNEIQKQVSKIIKSLIIMFSTAIGGSILLMMIFLIVLAASGSNDPSTAGGAAIIVALLAFLGVLIYAFCLYLIGIKGFGKRLDDVGRSAANLMFWGNLMPACVAFVGCWFVVIAPVFAMSFIVCGAVASWVLMLLGSFKLPKSSALNAGGVQGAITLRTSTILAAASSLLGVVYSLTMMPMMMDIIEQGDNFIYSMGSGAIFSGIMWVLVAMSSSILSILAIVFMFIGWGKIRRSFVD